MLPLRFGLSAAIDVSRSPDLPFDFKPRHSMAKKQHSIAPPNPQSVPNKDIMQRLNFLYQASTYLSSLPATKGSMTPTTQPKTQAATPSGPKGKEKRREETSLATPAYLSRACVSSMKAIGQKTVVKL